MKFRRLILLMFISSWFATAFVTRAFLRNHYSDQEVVSRSDLIVIGKMNEGSLSLVIHGPAEGTPAAWLDRSSSNYHLPSYENRLTLDVSELLKGHLSTTSIVIRVHHGLDPIVGGYSSNEMGVFYLRGTTNYPRDMVQIFDTGSSAKPSRPVSGDIRTNHIWLLRTEGVANGSSGIMSISDPEDIRPVEMWHDLRRYLK